MLNIIPHLDSPYSPFFKTNPGLSEHKWIGGENWISVPPFLNNLGHLAKICFFLKSGLTDIHFPHAKDLCLDNPGCVLKRGDQELSEYGIIFYI